MTYDYFAINYPSIIGFLFLLTFLLTNSSTDVKIKRTFYLMIAVEFVEMLTYSLELWTTTFATLSPMRLWLSAVGYSVRPFIFYLMLMLALRDFATKKTAWILAIPALINIFVAFSVFFTDIAYSYTPDNQFLRGPLGFNTHLTVILYLVTLVIAVLRTHAGRPKLETLIIFAISLLSLLAMILEAVWSIRTINRTSIIMITIFYYMFFQTQNYHMSLSKEQHIRTQLEYANRFDGYTGVLNKKAFADEAKKLLTAQDGQPLSSLGFLFLDLDHLKELNDTLGHSVGDLAITEMAGSIQSLCRKTDLIGRFGGDEFCVLIPDIPRQRFYSLLDDMQANLRKEYTAADVTIGATASIGAVYSENVPNLEYDRLVQMADEALYAAKTSGRDCHIVKEC